MLQLSCMYNGKCWFKAVVVPSVFLVQVVLLFLPFMSAVLIVPLLFSCRVYIILCYVSYVPDIISLYHMSWENRRKTKQHASIYIRREDNYFE